MAHPFERDSRAAAIRAALRRARIPMRPMELLTFMRDTDDIPWLYREGKGPLARVTKTLRCGAVSLRVPIRRSLADRRYYVYDEAACPAGDATIH